MTDEISETKPFKGLGMEGAVAHWYARSTANLMPEFEADARRVSTQLSPGAKVLEVAPGPGYFAIELSKLGRYQVLGLDISKTMVEIARQNASRAGVSADFRQGSASDIPFPDEQFDFLYCRAAFKNFTEPVRALQEMHRVLKPGGRALIIDLRRDASMPQIKAEVSRMHLGAFSRLMTRLTFRFMLLKRAYTRNQFLDLLTQTRFSSTRVDEIGIGLDIQLQK
jgi:ubiquinone/menaquinone biosynthesis C-methylase UbiE